MVSCEQIDHPTSIHHRLVEECKGRRFHKGRHEAKLDSMLLEECLLVQLAHLNEVAAGRRDSQER